MILDLAKARSIAAGWIAPSNPNLTAFATGHPDWDTSGLIAELEFEIDYVNRRPEHFDADETVHDIGTPAQNIEELRSLIWFVRTLEDRKEQA